MRFKLRGCDITKGPNRREVLPEDTDALFALRATVVVFTAGVAVFDHGVAYDHGYAVRQSHEFVFERPAVEQNGVMRAAETGSKLIHDADAGTDKFVFGALTDFGDFGERQRACGRTKKRAGGGNLQGG